MSHSLTKIWIHTIWTTKERVPMLNDSVRPKIIQHLSRGFSEQDCLVRVIDGTTDHLHSQIGRAHV